MSGLLMSHREKISCIFQTFVSICAMKMLAKESKLLSLCPLHFLGFVGSAFH